MIVGKRALPALSLVTWEYPRGMPKVSVYLPDDLYREVRERDLPLSKLAQKAVEDAIRRTVDDEWIERMRHVPRRTTSDIEIADVMAAVRDEFGA